MAYLPYDIYETLYMQDLVTDNQVKVQDQECSMQNQYATDCTLQNTVSTDLGHWLESPALSYNLANNDNLSPLGLSVTNTSGELLTPCATLESEINADRATVNRGQDDTEQEFEHSLQTLQGCDTGPEGLADDIFWNQNYAEDFLTTLSWPEQSTVKNQAAWYTSPQDPTSTYPWNHAATSNLDFPANCFQNDLYSRSDNAVCAIPEPFEDPSLDTGLSHLPKFGSAATFSPLKSNNGGRLFLPSWLAGDQAVPAEDFNGLLQPSEEIDMLAVSPPAAQHSLEQETTNTLGRSRGSTARDPTKDQFLLQCKAQGMSYKQIKARGGFQEAESTLRGRYRTLTKPKDERVRRPEWTDHDIDVLKQTVAQHLRNPAALFSDQSSQSRDRRTRAKQHALKKVPWKQIADHMYNKGCYRYGNATVKKKYLEVMGVAYGHPHN